MNQVSKTKESPKVKLANSVCWKCRKNCSDQDDDFTWSYFHANFYGRVKQTHCPPVLLNRYDAIFYHKYNQMLHDVKKLFGDISRFHFNECKPNVHYYVDRNISIYNDPPAWCLFKNEHHAKAEQEYEFYLLLNKYLQQSFSEDPTNGHSLYKKLIKQFNLKNQPIPVNPGFIISYDYRYINDNIYKKIIEGEISKLEVEQLIFETAT